MPQHKQQRPYADHDHPARRQSPADDIGARIGHPGDPRPDQSTAPIEKGINIHRSIKIIEQPRGYIRRQGNPPDNPGIQSIVIEQADIPDFPPERQRIMRMQLLDLAEFRQLFAQTGTPMPANLKMRLTTP